MSKALEGYVYPVAYCEIDRYAKAVQLSRMVSGGLPSAPIWNDIKTFSAEVLGYPWAELDIVTAGFPCQDLSVAGHGKGLEGERSGLFFQVVRVVSEIRPKFVFLENVPALAVRGLDRVLLELNSLGYDCRWTIVSAAEVGAPHLRERIFILAHAHGERRRSESVFIGRLEDSPVTWDDGEKEFMAHAEREGLEGRQESQTAWEAFAEFGCEGAFRRARGLPKPTIRRDDDGFSYRVDRIRCLGNAVVPEQTRRAFMRLMGLNNISKVNGGNASDK